jgi:hypothetical protein
VTSSDRHDSLAENDEPAPAPQVQATYADHSVPLDEAGQKLREAISNFETTMREWRDRSATSLVLEPPIHVIKIGTGGGKTHETAAKIAVWLPRGWRIAIAVPDHELARQVAQTIGAHDGVPVKIYRGYTQPDPSAPGHEMCRNLPAYKAACDLGVSIRSAVCERQREDGKIVSCPSVDVCGYERQRKLKPDARVVWVLTHATLRYNRPDFITELDGLVIDEKFFDGGIGKPESDSDDETTVNKSQKINVAALLTAKIEGCNDEERDFLTHLRHRLFDAVRLNDDGYLSRRAVDDAGITAEDAHRAAVLEQRRVTPKVLTPGMDESELKDQVTHHKAPNKRARAAGAVWEEVATLLIHDRDASGRLKVAGSNVTVTQHRPVHPTWHAPVLALDATAASPKILQQALFGDSVWRPDNATVTDIAIKRPDYVHVRQVFGAPVTMGKLGLLDDDDEKPRTVRAIVRYIRWCAFLATPDRIGLISYKKFIEKISNRLPANVITLHFGELNGRNDMERVAGLIVIGRPWVPPSVVEANAAVLTGVPVQSIERYELPPGGVQLVDGSVVARDVERHPHPIAEEIRWQVPEAGVIQAKGRLRDLRRKESCWMDILNDVVLPGTVNEVVDWKKDVKPGAEADMAAEGVILTNSRDAMRALGVSKDDAEAVRNCPGFSINIYRKTRAVILNGAIEKRTPFSPVRFTYRREGARGPVSNGYFLPAILPERELKAWLETKLGPLASLEIERRDVWMGGVVEREPAGMPLGELAGVIGGWLGELTEADDG